MMKILHSALGIIFAFALMFTLLITSVEVVTYWTPGYYENEYEKYDVLDDVHMEMDDLLDVTHEMMAYLRGNRADLHVPTIVNGHPGNSLTRGKSPIWRMCAGSFSVRLPCAGSVSF